MVQARFEIIVLFYFRTCNPMLSKTAIYNNFNSKNRGSRVLNIATRRTQRPLLCLSWYVCDISLGHSRQRSHVESSKAPSLACLSILNTIVSSLKWSRAASLHWWYSGTKMACLKSPDVIRRVTRSQPQQSSLEALRSGWCLFQYSFGVVAGDNDNSEHLRWLKTVLNRIELLRTNQNRCLKKQEGKPTTCNSVRADQIVARCIW